MAGIIVGLFFALLAVLVCADGLMTTSAADNIMQQLYGALMLVLAAALFGLAILCGINSSIDSFLKAFRKALSEQEQQRRAEADRTTTRFEELLVAIQRIDDAPIDAPKPATRDNDDGDFAKFQVPDSIHVRCGKCGKSVKAKPDWAGRSGNCPGCGGEIEFPTFV